MNKYVIIALWLAVVAVAGTGCAKKDNKQAAAGGKPGFSPAVTEINPSATYTPAPVAAAPVFEPAGPIVTPAVAQTSAGGSYQVKKGDTLFAIARNHYGDGKQWTKIASANPGLSPQTLKAGQRITIP